MTKMITNKQAEAILEKSAKKVTQKDLQKVVNNADKIEQEVAKGGPLAKFLSDVKTMLSMVKDYFQGNYKEIPWWSLAAVIAALLYVINPLDLIPDAIPGVGQLDDAAVVACCLTLVRVDLRNYQAWKAKQITA